jgi:hypothetical protein
MLPLKTFDIVIPILLEKGIPCFVTIVKYWSILLLADILETGKEENLTQRMKFKGSKVDRQLLSSYNIREKVKEVIAPYLKDIIIITIESVSELEKGVWNQIEEELGGSKTPNTEDINTVNEQRISTSKESELYDMLGNAKDLLTPEVFENSILDLIKIIKKGTGLSTRAAACDFIINTLMEKPELVKLKFAK